MNFIPPIAGVRPVPEVRAGDILVIEIPADMFRVVCEAVNHPDDFAGYGVHKNWPKGTGWAIEVRCIGGSLIGASYWKQTEDGGILTNLSRTRMGAEFRDRRSGEPFGVVEQRINHDTRRVDQMRLSNGRMEFTVTKNEAIIRQYPDQYISFVTFGLEYELC